MNKVEGAQIVGVIASAYPQWKPTKETIEVYVSLLEDLDVVEAKEAVKRLVMASEYPPSVASIRRKVLELQDGLPLTKAEAWELVMLLVHKNGTYNRPAIEDEITQMVVNSIGWREICTSTNVDTVRAQFFRLYDELAEKKTTEKLESRAFNSSNHTLEGVKVRGEIEAQDWSEPRGQTPSDEPSALSM